MKVSAISSSFQRALGPRCRLWHVLFYGLTMAILPDAASAALITIPFQGVVTQKSGGYYWEPGVGRSVWGSYTFESSAPDINSLSSRGIYSGAVVDVNLYGWVGGSITSLYQNNWGNISIYNNLSAAPYDEHLLSSSTFASHNFRIWARDNTATMYSNDSLPLQPPSISTIPSYWELNLATGWDRYGDPTGWASSSGNITAWEPGPLPLPLPSAVWLFVSGGVLLRLVSRRKSVEPEQRRHPGGMDGCLPD